MSATPSAPSTRRKGTETPPQLQSPRKVKQLFQAVTCGARSEKVFPSETRECLTSYRGRMQAIIYQRRTGHDTRLWFRAHHELVRRHEDFGGHFIVNNERLIRYLILPCRNHVISLIRPSFATRGPYTMPFKSVAQSYGITGENRNSSFLSCSY
ncbi:hypothetical protein SCLCIDRAFT_778280 [Scleroderma citrinum Foug A]|uniref:Uncharacterized protein n=1 Tax=Scleroderma citrinum Foug A TaxID=1036808 RepID=A0A0C3E2Y3_9AGAM|nr:hypothetical protein SCLCIDRAFT_778280 [Scleroderma citrinum Foug A]